MKMDYFRPTGINSSINIALLGIMTALAAIMTIVIQIPYPGTSGYFNFGDTMVMLGGLLLGPVGGFFAGGIGSALADIVTGYTFYAPITLIVKGLEGMAVGYLSSKAQKEARLNGRDIFAVVVGSIIMLTGYFIAQVFLFGIVVAMGELVTVNLAQVTIGAIATLLIGPTIRSYLQTINYRQPENSAESPFEETSIE
jgi:uncharacterized membrane protein